MKNHVWIRLFFIGCFGILSLSIFGNDSIRVQNSIKPKKYDTLYIQSHRHLVGFSVLGIRRSFSFNYKFDNHTTSCKYSNPNVGLRGTYSFLGGEVSFAIPERWYKKDTVSSTHWGMDIMSLMRKFWLQISIHDYKNMQDRSVQSSDHISNLFAYAGILYVVNYKRYSHRATIFQIEQQKRSAGSILCGISMSHNGLDMYNSEDDNRYQLFIRSRYIGVTAGYSHTFVYRKNWFATMFVFPRVVVQKDYKLLNAEATAELHLDYASEARVSCGYNSSRFFTGVTFYINNSNSNTQQLGTIRREYYYLRFFFGKRFNIFGKKE